jgi:hypothetical protein
MQMEPSQNQPKSNWDKYKESQSANGKARPWHILNPGLRVTEDVIQSRLAICRECDRFIKATQQCRECGCIMPLKTRLSNASCPIEKW